MRIFNKPNLIAIITALCLSGCIIHQHDNGNCNSRGRTCHLQTTKLAVDFDTECYEEEYCGADGYCYENQACNHSYECFADEICANQHYGHRWL